MTERVIFVCTGNTCRSPMAEALLKAQLKDSLPGIEVISRGLNVFPGSSLSPETKEVLSDAGLLQYLGHNGVFRPTQLYDDDITDNTLILAMTGSHLSSIMRMFRHANVLTVKGYAGSYGDVPDPFGGTREVYDRCFLELSGLIRSIAGRLSHNI